MKWLFELLKAIIFVFFAVNAPFYSKYISYLCHLGMCYLLKKIISRSY